MIYQRELNRNRNCLVLSGYTHYPEPIFGKEKLCYFKSVSVYSVDPNINSVITPLTSQYTNSPIQA